MAIEVVAAVLVRDGRVLAARRAAHRREGGLWELPGGKVEPGETEAAALARELREELDVDVRVGEVVGVSEHGYAHGAVRLTALRCHLVSGVPRAVDHDALRWLAADELHDVSWAPADVPLLAAVRAALDG